MGRATALALAEAGTRNIIHYGRSAEEAKTVLTEIRNSGGHADIVSADLAAPDGPAALAEQVRRISGASLEIIVANDHMIPPPAQELMAKRMKATTRFVHSSHAPFISSPQEVADIITLAAESLVTAAGLPGK